jgi:hypothetical protein
MRSIRCALLLCVLCLPCGSIFPDDYSPQLDFWPVFFYAKDKKSDETTVELLWPLFSWNEDKKSKGFFFHPFYNKREEKGKKHVEEELLWPFGHTITDEDLKNSRFFPFYFYTEDKKPDGHVEKDFTFLPFIFGRKKPGEDYNAVFPFYGRITKRYGRDEIIFVLWPIYTWQKKDDITAVNILWPFFSYSKYEGGGGFKFWPLFGYSVKKDKFSKTFILWPFYSRQHVTLEEGGTYDMTLVPLFYVKEDSPAGTTRGAWPFVLNQVNKKEKYTEKWYPWPFLGDRRGEKDRLDQIWPFYVFRQHGQSKTTNYLWPFSWFYENKTINSTEKSARIFPIYYQYEEKWDKDKSTETYLQIWPVMHTDKDREENRYTQAISPIWLRQDAAFQRNWGPFFWIFQSWRSKKGDTSDRILWRVFRHDKKGETEYLEVRHVFAVLNEGKEKGALRLLGNVLAFERDKGTERVKLLGFPILGGEKKSQSAAPPK